MSISPEALQYKALMQAIDETIKRNNKGKVVPFDQTEAFLMNSRVDIAPHKINILWE